MQENVILKMTDDFYPDKENSFFTELFQQYNKVMIESLITSFGLDLIFTKTGIINDQHGGDVDTIHNVRKIGEDLFLWNRGKKEIKIKNPNYDPLMTYKNINNKKEYEMREKYNSDSYHKHENYISTNNQISKLKKEGMLYDSYIGKKIAQNETTNLDHVISAKEIHEDRIRILAGLKGEDLANNPDNLKVTNVHTNQTKSAYPMEEFLRKKEGEYNEEQLKNMKEQDKKAREIYNTRINIVYYTSSKFRKDVFNSSMKVGTQMGIRQAVGFILSEVIFTVMEEFEKEEKIDNFEKIFLKVSSGVKRGFEKAKEKYKEIIIKFKDGVLSGILASLTTTLTNIFFTTSKNIVKIIRQVWVSIIEAIKILFLNPDNLLFGERMRATAKILATGASIAIGIITKEFLNKFGIYQIPYIGETLVNFIELFTVGITTCTFLYFLDRSEIANRLVSILNKVPTMSNVLNYYKEQAKYFENYAAELLKMDLKSFEDEVDKFNIIANKLENAKTETEINSVLKQFFIKIKLEFPWEGDFNSFMEDKNTVLVFK